MGDLWVFGYGSLMWNPGFAIEERRRARLHGVHRGLCIHSWVHRGTRENPGLVLGLARGGSCTGIAFRVAEENRTEVIAYLRERELVTSVYLESWRPVRLETGEKVRALTYVADPDHEQYAGRLDDTEIAAIVRTAAGKSGTNMDYVCNTVAHLREQAVHDPHLEAVFEALARTRPG
ncbi:MAG: gamma-glutamylcyclotransferase [Nitratireductor sp.]|nr:gamma-glutamylcyclotransferase [Nitratireductor sp.]MCB1455870.1 gamma-glutamylcyclotransferase [Nitratireductor sp.]